MTEMLDETQLYALHKYSGILSGSVGELGPLTDEDIKALRSEEAENVVGIEWEDC